MICLQEIITLLNLRYSLYTLFHGKVSNHDPDTYQLADLTKSKLNKRIEEKWTEVFDYLHQCAEGKSHDMNFPLAVKQAIQVYGKIRGL